MKAYHLPRRPVLLLLTLTLCVPAWTAAQQIPSPEQFFGHQMGADRQLARWDKLVEYYDMIGERSDRVQVWHMGPSTLGNPFLSIFVSSPENLANLDEIKRMNAILQDPRGHSEAEVDNAIENSKVVFVQSYGLHSTEVAASQSAAEIMYDFATRNDDGINEILDNTVSILIPAFNPDGNIIVTDWYNRWVGTEYEGSGPPELYHHFIGHDNNRDAFMQATIESWYGAEILFREWVPQAYIDHHQMGPYTARIYLPPYAEPIRPGGDPLVWREMTWYGAHMAYKMDEAELDGAIGAAIYSGWGHFGFHWITPFHNIAGMLTESASARLATPLYVHPDQLGGSRQLPEYAEQTTFPSPWPGGWWRVRDIVDRQILATFSPLELAAKNRETVLRNAYNKASRQTRRGMEDDSKAFVISADQHDPLPEHGSHGDGLCDIVHPRPHGRFGHRGPVATVPCQPRVEHVCTQSFSDSTHERIHLVAIRGEAMEIDQRYGGAGARLRIRPHHRLRLARAKIGHARLTFREVGIDVRA